VIHTPSNEGDQFTYDTGYARSNVVRWTILPMLKSCLSARYDSHSHFCAPLPALAESA
jgi:hypothetical protein